MGTEVWLSLAHLSISQLPDRGSCPGAYVFRDTQSKEIIYIGSTRSLRRRLLANHLGGVGGRQRSGSTPC